MSLVPFQEIAMTLNLEHDRHFGVRRLVSSVAIGLTALSLANASYAGDLNVPSMAYPNIQVAIAAASDGDVIILGPGIHSNPIDLGTLEITVKSSDGPDVTTLNAFGLGTVITIKGGQTTATVIEGITITGGNAPLRGGGIDIDGASATVRNCRITGNFATLDPGGDGGGLFIETGDLVLEDTVFLNNQSNDVGGGAYFRTGTNVTVTNCHFEGNVSGKGGAVATNGSITTMSDTTFFLNGTQLATEDGGAIWAFNSTVNVDRCHFETNVIFDDGSAIMAQDGSDVDLLNSVFLNNVSDSNATIYSWKTGTNIDVLHCTMVGNIAAGTSSLRAFESGTINFHNGIIWGHTGGGVISGSVAATYSTIQDGYAGAGNLSVDPMLDTDLALLPGSPAIDAANTYVLLGDDPRDHNMNPRAVADPDTVDTGVPVYGINADMGAFEYQVAGAGVDTCPSDTDADLMVGVLDFLNVLAAWGACPN